MCLGARGVLFPLVWLLVLSVELLAAVRLFPLRFDGCLLAGVARIEFREQGEFLL